MKVGVGSIQEKTNGFYFVRSINRRQKWINLHTKFKSVAIARAKELCFHAESEIEWREELVELGEKSRHALKTMNQKKTSFDDLWLNWISSVPGGVSACTQVNCKRYLRIFEQWLAMNANFKMPYEINKTETTEFLHFLCAEFVSAPRMIRFYKRLWKSSNIDADVWDFGRIKVVRQRRRFRRISATEFRILLNFCERENESVLHDVIVIGLYTGLRLSDICELDCDEIESPDFLCIMPNKTRTRRLRPLLIPLTSTVAKIISARRRMVRSGRLFPGLTPSAASKRIQRIFASCGIRSSDRELASFHSLRTTFITLLDEAGISPYVTDAITGHADGGMHARYSQPSKKVLLQAVKRLPLAGS